MNLSERDRRALMFLAPFVGLILLVNYVVFPFFDAASDSSRSIESREKILLKYRQFVAATSMHETSNGLLNTVLSNAEQGLLVGATPALQAAEVQQLVRDAAAAQGISLRSVDFVAPKAAGPDYAQVSVSTGFIAGMDQVVALMNALQASPKILMVDHLSLRAANLPATPTVPAKKQVSVNFLISGVARATPK